MVVESNNLGEMGTNLPVLVATFCFGRTSARQGSNSESLLAHALPPLLLSRPPGFTFQRRPHGPRTYLYLLSLFIALGSLAAVSLCSKIIDTWMIRDGSERVDFPFDDILCFHVSTH